MDDKKISFIGAGRVGTSLSYLLKAKGYNVIGITSRSISSAERAATFMGNSIAYSNDIFVFVEDSDIVFITTNDDAVPYVAEGMSKNCEIRENQIFLHTSGSLSSSVLKPLKERGGIIASLHPLQTVANPEEGIKNIVGSIFAIEGDERAIPVLKEMVKNLEGVPFHIPEEKKPLYHLAAVIACNYFVTLVDTSLEIFKNISIDEEVGLEGLLKLVHGTMNNMERLGTKNALTGPIARGDIETVRGHLKAMKNFAPELTLLYKVLGDRTIKIAKEKGTLKAEDAKRLKELFSLS
ncbi:MAG: Rossmann-like and DUF2520 domain-containing protein [bacterium]